MINIFEFLDANAYIRAVWEDKKAKNRSLTVRAWSLKMGFAHPTVLYEVIANKRAISKSHVRPLAENLKLREEEVIFLELLIDYRKARCATYKKDLEAKLMQKLQAQGMTAPSPLKSTSVVDSARPGLITAEPQTVDFLLA